MKPSTKTLAIIFICAILFMLAGCSNKPTDEEILAQTFSNYQKAIQDENSEALKGFISAERQKEMPVENAAMAIQMIKALLPTNIKITGTEISGNKALLKLEGLAQGQKTTGTVEFVKEGGIWKLSKEDWQMTLQFTENAESGSNNFNGPVETFMTDPRKPPEPQQILSGHQGEITRLAFTPDNRFLVSASYGDYSIRVWDPLTGEELSQAKTENRVRSMALTPDGTHILTADADQYIISWPLEEGIIGAPKTLVRDVGDILAISSNNKLVTAGLQKKLQLWNDDDGSFIEEISDQQDTRSLVFSYSGKWLAAGGRGNQYTLWNTENWKQKSYKIKKVAKDSDIAAIDISRDDKYLATGHMDSSIVIFNLEEREELFNFYVRDAATWDVKFSPDGKLLATAQQDKHVYLWEVESSAHMAKLAKHTEAVHCLAFSPDGTTLASGGEDRQIILWRCGTLPVLPQNSGDVHIPNANTKPAPQPAEESEPEMMELDGQKNLIKNPYGTQNLQFWQTKGDTFIELDEEANPYFVVRYNGVIWQEVPIRDAEGRWALLIAWASSERINPEDDHTGLPYLYGTMISRKEKNRIHTYLQEETMLHSLRKPNEWGLIWGIFPVPEDTGAIQFFMQQADGRSAQNGSAARFDEPGIFLFDSKEEAMDFVKRYQQ